MPDILPIKYKPSGSSQSEGYTYSSGVNKTNQFGAALLTYPIQYGSTVETNYYSGYEVPNNGYVLVNSDDYNRTFIYVAADDSSFITLSNQIFTQNFSTIQNSLSYIFTATTWTVLNYNKSFIPFNYFSAPNFLSGAGIHQDIGNTMCYPKTGTDIYDIDGGGLPAVATNGPIFSASTPGFFTFDGTNDYIFKSLGGGLSESRTINQIWLRPRYSAAKTIYEVFDTDLRLLQTITNTVFTIKTTSDNNILFGGAITNINGTNGNLFKTDSGFTLNVGFTPPILNDGAVIYDVIESNTGKIYIGGSFSSVNGTSVGYGLARLNSNGTLDNTFNIGVGFSGEGYTAQINSIVEDSSGNLYVGGNFNYFTGQTYNKLIKLNSNGGVVTSFNIGLGIRTGTATTSAVFVNDLVLSSDGLRLYVGGEFTTYNSGTVNANRLVRLLTSDGSRDSTFNMTTGVNNDVETMLLDSSENLYVGGQFTSVLGTLQNRIARITSGGTLDTTFVVGSGFASTVNRLKFDTSGKILAAGQFTTYSGLTYQRLILLNTNGSVDTTLNTVSGFNNTVRDLIQLSNGSIIIGGLFTQYKAVSRPQIIRISNTGTYDTTVTSLDGTNVLQFQPYSNLILGYQSYYLFSGTTYDFFGGNPFPNTTTNRNNIFDKWYLITKVSNGSGPPYDFYINGEKVFSYSGATSISMYTYGNSISSPTNAFLGDISEYIVRGLTALTDNDVLVYFNQTKSRYGY